MIYAMLIAGFRGINRRSLGRGQGAWGTQGAGRFANSSFTVTKGGCVQRE
jgi:hypothetical protein